MLKTESTIDLPTGKALWLIHLSDIHKGNNTTRIDELERVLEKYSKMNAVFAGTGDFFDLIALQDMRFQLSQAGGMDKEVFADDFIDAMVDDFAKMWLKYKIPPERVLFFGQGNHEWQYVKRVSSNPLKRLCKTLGITYGGYSGFHTLKLREKTGRTQNLVIYYHHGYGGGSRTGGYPITKYEKEMIHHQADIYLFGHDHGKRLLVEYPLLSPSSTGENVYLKNRILAINGTFMISKPVSEFAGWPEMKGFPPSGMGCLPIKIQYATRRVNGKPRRWVEARIYD
jgi:hypothetical protein